VKILYFSDVHIEIRADDSRVPWTDIYPLDLGPDLSAFVGAVDLVILAGDIGTIRPRGNVSTVGYAEQVGAYLRCGVIVVPGNHEYYRGLFEDDRDALIATNVPGVTALDRGEILVPFQGRSLRVLGATLWTD
jgi:predicted phosphodiesterase